MTFETNVPYVQKVYESLKKSIIIDELKQGQILNEREISEALNISRTPLRDGLNLLEQEGWIQKSGKSRIVSSLTWKDICDIYELRTLNECYAIRKVAQNRTQADVEACLLALNSMEENFLHDPDAGRLDFLVSDQAWHLSLDRLCGNDRMIQTLEKLYDQFVRISYITTKKGHLRMRESIKEHRLIYQAILEQNPDKAQNALKAHQTAWFHALNENWEGPK